MNSGRVVSTPPSAPGIIAQSNVQVRMQTAKAPAHMVPRDAYLRERRRKWHNGEGIDMFHEPPNNIPEKTAYKHDEDGGTMIVPGHGRLSDEYDLGEYREMISIVRRHHARPVREAGLYGLYGLGETSEAGSASQRYF